MVVLELPFKVRNRRLVGVLERLHEMAGATLGGAPIEGRMPPDFGDPPGFADAQRAISLADAGQDALTLAIVTAGDPTGDHPKRITRKVWKAMTPDAGARASIFYTHSLAEVTARQASAPGHHLDPKRQQEARELLRAHYPWSDEEEAVVQEQAGLIDPETLTGVEEARMGLVLHAISMIVGRNEALRLPGLALLGPGAGLDRYSAQMAWQFCFNRGLPPYLERSDPDGMARWQAGRNDGAQNIREEP